MNTVLKNAFTSLTNIHLPDGRPNVFIFSMPRSGSTWLMELILTQPGFKSCEEPFNLAHPPVREHLGRHGITTWAQFHDNNTSAVFERYIQGFLDGKLSFKNPFFYRNHFRLITRRIVFKMLHAGEDRINWFRDRFNGRIVFLIRHPIAVSLSRQIYPRLDALLTTDYSRNFTAGQLRYARKVLESGTKLERGVLDWCLQNAVPLRNATPDWLIVSYEQLVIEPRPVLELLAKRLELPKPERMLHRLTVPSASTYKSDGKTQQVLKSGLWKSENDWLVNKWREKVTEEEERRAMKILEQFDLNVYHFGDALPADSLWIGGGPRNEPEAPHGACPDRGMEILRGDCPEPE